MVPSLRSLLVGRADQSERRWLAAVVFAAPYLLTWVAYASGVFRVTGGAIVLPTDATLLGMVAASGVGLRRHGLVYAWLSLVGAYLGFLADATVSGLSGYGLGGQFASFLDPVTLGVYLGGALVYGTTAFALGAVSRWVLVRVAERTVA